MVMGINLLKIEFNVEVVVQMIQNGHGCQLVLLLNPIVNNCMVLLNLPML